MCSQSIPPSSFSEPEAYTMSTLETQEKIQAPVGFFNKSIRRKRNEIIKKWAGMSMFILSACTGIPDKREGGGGGKQGRLMGDDGSVINWSIYAGLPIPLYDPAPSPSMSRKLTANTMRHPSLGRPITHLQKPLRLDCHSGGL